MGRYSPYQGCCLADTIAGGLRLVPLGRRTLTVASGLPAANDHGLDLGREFRWPAELRAGNEQINIWHERTSAGRYSPLITRLPLGGAVLPKDEFSHMVNADFARRVPDLGTTRTLGHQRIVQKARVRA